ncbi:MAG: class I SAM-dependent methyltransferase [Acidimicrobiales bacterium]|nr:class I SAM-dependent methyltransferase [Acidimicrobiales bacterium]
MDGAQSMAEDYPGDANIDRRVVEAFGHEWTRFDNLNLDFVELQEMFEGYFSIFPFGELPDGAVGFDAGCGSGRWAQFVAPKVGRLICIDASHQAITVAKSTLADHQNVEYRTEDISALELPTASCDFGYSLGVLHHIPNTEQAARSLVSKLKPGAPFLVYLYYDLADSARVHRGLLSVVTAVRFLTSRLPRLLRQLVADLIALVVYLPLSRAASFFERLGFNETKFPLFQYRHRSFSVLRNDALDRFGTRLEKRYDQDGIRRLLEDAGLEDIVFSDKPPWWVACGRRAPGRQ